MEYNDNSVQIVHMVAILSAFQNAHIVEPLGHEVDARRSDLLVGLGP